MVRLRRCSRRRPSRNAERQFIHGLRYIDDLLLRDRDTNADGTLDERLYAMQDPNWNVTAVANTTGDIQERYAYQGYGVPSFLTPTFGSRANSSFAWEALFAGYRWDIETGLYQVRFRSIAPHIGDWLERDPIGLVAGMNLYGYVQQMSVNSVDAFGLDVSVGAALAVAEPMTLGEALVMSPALEFFGGAALAAVILAPLAHADQALAAAQAQGHALDMQRLCRQRQQSQRRNFCDLREGTHGRPPTCPRSVEIEDNPQFVANDFFDAKCPQNNRPAGLRPGNVLPFSYAGADQTCREIFQDLGLASTGDFIEGSGYSSVIQPPMPPNMTSPLANYQIHLTCCTCCLRQGSRYIDFRYCARPHWGSRQTLTGQFVFGGGLHYQHTSGYHCNR